MVFTKDLREKIEEMEENLSRWQGEVEDDVNFDEKLAQLKEERSHVEEILDKIEDASESEREELREELDSAWNSMTETYDELFRDDKENNEPSSKLLKGKTSAMGDVDDAI